VHPRAGQVIGTHMGASSPQAERVRAGIRAGTERHRAILPVQAKRILMGHAWCTNRR
jgi:hypothetical protein